MVSPSSMRRGRGTENVANLAARGAQHFLRSDDFERFYEARFEQLLQRIESAIGKQIAREPSESTVSSGETTIDFEGAAAPTEDELSPDEVETMEEELTTVG